MGNRKDDVADPYIDQHGVLVNKLGITNPDKLQRAETELSGFRSIELSRTPISGMYDLKHLQDIHRHMFQDVYPWAGEIRTVDISKGGDLFAKHQFIESAARKVFKELAEERFYLQECNTVNFCDRAAYHLGEINALHPFREGNGRVQRLFISQLAQEAGRHIDWSQTNQKAMIAASIDALYGSHEKIADIMSQVVGPARERGRGLGE